MNKRLLIPSLAVFLCLALLVGAFLIVPQATHAKAPNTPISVTQPSDCTQITTIGNAQMCDMIVTMPQNVSKGIQFHVSDSGVWCYASCNKASLSGVVYTSEPEGNTLYSTSNQVPIVIIAPLSEHGSLTITFVITGPSNSIKTQLVVSNSCC